MVIIIILLFVHTGYWLRCSRSPESGQERILSLLDRPEWGKFAWARVNGRVDDWIGDHWNTIIQVREQVKGNLNWFWLPFNYFYVCCPHTQTHIAHRTKTGYWILGDIQHSRYENGQVRQSATKCEWIDSNACIEGKRDSPFAFLPAEQEGKLKESINIGPGDVPLEDKTLTVVYGADFVNVNFINFCTFSKEIAQVSVVLLGERTQYIEWFFNWSIFWIHPSILLNHPTNQHRNGRRKYWKWPTICWPSIVRCTLSWRRLMSSCAWWQTAMASCPLKSEFSFDFVGLGCMRFQQINKCTRNGTTKKNDYSFG